MYVSVATFSLARYLDGMLNIRYLGVFESPLRVPEDKADAQMYNTDADIDSKWYFPQGNLFLQV